MKKENIIELIREWEKSLSMARLKEIVPYTTSPESEVRNAAIRAATRIIKSSLLESYHEIEGSLRRSLVHLLVKINPDIIHVMKSELFSQDPYKRVRAIQIVGLVGKQQQVEELLLQMIRDTDEKIRATVIQTLGEMVGKSEANILITLLNDMDERVRANTIEALEKLGNRNLVGILSRYRQDPNNRIRANTLKALWNLGAHDIFPYLEEMISSAGENMRASAAWLIGEIGKKDAVFFGELKKIKYENSTLVKNNVIRALLKMDPGVAQAHLNRTFDSWEVDEVKTLYRMK